MISMINKVKYYLSLLRDSHSTQKEILERLNSVLTYQRWSSNKNLFHEMMKHMRVKLPVDIALKRFGNSHDGGYVLADDFDFVINAYSFGIANEVSWDQEMAERGINIFQFDPTIDETPLQHPRFTFEKAGICGGEHNFLPRNPAFLYYTLEEIINKYSPEDNKLILKMDVEGFEYESLLNSLHLLHKFSQMVIEFHGLNHPMYSKIFCMLSEKILESHELIHVHANNADEPFCIDGNTICGIMEFSYLRRDNHTFKPSNLFYPTFMDGKNILSNPDLLIGYLGKDQ